MNCFQNIYLKERKIRSSSTCYHDNGIGYTGLVNRTITGAKFRAKCRSWFENPYINNITYPTLVITAVIHKVCIQNRAVTQALIEESGIIVPLSYVLTVNLIIF